MFDEKDRKMKLFQSIPIIANTEKQALQYDEYQKRILGDTYRVTKEKIVDCITVSKDKQFRVLDCGIGTGNTALKIAERFPKALITGIDASESYLRIAKLKIKKLKFDNRITLKKINLHKGIPKNIEKFDFVISQYVFHYHFNRIHLFKSIHTSLRPSGKIIFSIFIPLANNRKNSKWWEEKEKNAFIWYKKRILDNKTAKMKAKADRIILEKYVMQNCIKDPIKSYFSDLANAGFKSIECVWREGMDTIIQAVKVDNK